MKINNNNKIVLLIDGHYLMFRSWFGIPNPMINKNGIEVRAIYGFFNTTFRLINTLNPTHLAFVFDPKGPTFRNELYTEYKANRSETPEELKKQLEIITSKLPLTNIKSIIVDNYEADDVLGTISKKLGDAKTKILIYSGDSDLHQLIDDNIHIITTSRTGEIIKYNKHLIKEVYEGLNPNQIVDFKSLTGDTSDNIPGIPGVGKKTAIKLLNEFKTLDSLSQNLDLIKQGKLKNNLLEHFSNSLKAKQLIEIHLKAPVELDLNDIEILNIDNENLISFLKELDFNSLIQRLGKINIPGLSDPNNDNKNNESKITNEYEKTPHNIKLEVIDSISKLNNLIKILIQKKEFALDTETSSLDVMNNELVGISFSYGDSNGFYLPLNHVEDNNLPLKESLELLKPILESSEILKIAHNINFDLSVLNNAYKNLNIKINIKNFNFDTLIAANLLGYRNIGLKELVTNLFNIDLEPITNIIGKGKSQISIGNKPINEIAKYAINDAYFTYKLKQKFENELSNNNLDKLFDELEIKLIPILIQMQSEGMPINLNLLNVLQNDFANKISTIESNAKTLIQEEINLNSPQQLSKILFEKLNLSTENIKKTKSGYSTGSESITELINGLTYKFKESKSFNLSFEDNTKIQFLNYIQEYREISKLLSTYVMTLPKLLNSKTNRVHTKFNQAGTATGRLSSSEPNLQNIPKRTNYGKLVRSSFAVQKENNEFVSADYSQIELRVLAHFSEDPNLKNAFLKGEDIHNFTAATMYECDLTNVNDEMRRIAKILNFGVLYGLSPYGISKQTNLSVNKGKEFIELYFKRFGKIKDYIENTKEEIHNKGYVETLFGRKRYIDEIKSNNARIRAHGERMAVNMPIQGTAAEIIKIAMINLNNSKDYKKIKGKMLLQIHDELIFECDKNNSKYLTNILSKIMPNVVKLNVPLTINIEKGQNLGEMS
ncbi:MAG: DNA polymerase I [Chloroflexi bacterium]|nr:DNA polymerase I [Chloroflexota bacterium]